MTAAMLTRAPSSSPERSLQSPPFERDRSSSSSSSNMSFPHWIRIVTFDGKTYVLLIVLLKQQVPCHSRLEIAAESESNLVQWVNALETAAMPSQVSVICSLQLNDDVFARWEYHQSISRVGS